MKKGMKKAAITAAVIALLSACSTQPKYAWEETTAEQLNAILKDNAALYEQAWRDDYGNAMCKTMKDPRKGISHAKGLIMDDYTTEEAWTILSGIRNVYCPEFNG